jgi:hypothetical protein
MAPYLGDFKAGDVIRYLWHTNNSSGALATRTVNGTIAIVKDDGTTEITTGITDNEDFDGITGQHLLEIDVDAAGLTPGSDYFARLSDATVDSVAGVGAALMCFSFRNRGTDVVSRGQLTAASSGTFTIPDNGSRDKVKAGDYILVGIKDGDTGAGYKLIDAYNPATGDGVLRTGSTFDVTPIIGTYYEIVQFPTQEALADADLGDLGTQIDAIQAVTDDVAVMLEDDAGTPRFTANALEQGVAGVGDVNVASVSPGAIGAAAFAAGAIDAAALAADAVSEIQSNLATSAALAAANADIDAIAAAIVTALSDLNDIQGRLPAVLVGGKMDAVAEATVDEEAIATAVAAAVGPAIMDETDGIEPGISFRAAQRIALAVLIGLTTGVQSAATTFKSGDLDGTGGVLGTKDRVVATRNDDFDRLSVTVDVSAA